MQQSRTIVMNPPGPHISFNGVMRGAGAESSMSTGVEADPNNNNPMAMTTAVNQDRDIALGTD